MYSRAGWHFGILFTAFLSNSSDLMLVLFSTDAELSSTSFKELLPTTEFSATTELL